MLTQCCEATGQTLGLVPAWFWPDAEPPITALLDELELGMPSVRQHDPGDARWLSTRTANRSGARGRLGRMPGRATSQAGRRVWSIRRLPRFRQPACGPAARC